MVLYELELTSFPSDLSERGLQVFLLTFLVFNSVYIYLMVVDFLLIKKRKKILKPKGKVLSSRKIIYLFNFLLSLILIESIYSKGFPLVWKIMGIQKGYSSFGIPTVHGFVNSLAWVIAMCAFIHVLDQKNNRKRMIRIIVALCFVYVMLLARQTLVTGFVQLFAIYLLKRKVPVWRLLLMAVASVLLCGLVGNIRTGADHFRMVARMNTEIPDIFLGFYWVYLYVVTPVGNINSLVNTNMIFSNGLVMARSLLPTMLMGIFFGANRFAYHDFLVNKAFNVSGFLLVPYLDFGFYGVFGMTSLYGVVGYFTWRAYRRGRNNADATMQYAVYFQIAAMSFFVNMFTMLPIIIQFVYIKLFFRFDLITLKSYDCQE